MTGCCTSCQGTGISGDSSTSGLCWDCRALGCAHPRPWCRIRPWWIPGEPDRLWNPADLNPFHDRQIDPLLRFTLVYALIATVATATISVLSGDAEPVIGGAIGAWFLAAIFWFVGWLGRP